MPIKIKELRRRELIEATRTVIQQHGFERATISLIAKEAGFSIGFIHHHFKNKDDLLAETMRVLFSELPDYLSSELPLCNGPRERLYTILAANFHPHLFTKPNAFAWISYLARVPFQDEYLRLQNATQSR
ncbi:TetR family transcriptional regulator, partial [Escherichia coli]|nr:TetR family transcriptional regulator [Escherichia coli]